LLLPREVKFNIPFDFFIDGQFSRFKIQLL
jgi:hypothetical protein